MMDQRIKNTIIDAIMNVIKSAPTQNPAIRQHGINQRNFDIWLNYVNSTMQITSRHIEINLYLTVQNNIQQVVLQQGADYTSKIDTICKILFNFIQNIIYL